MVSFKLAKDLLLISGLPSTYFNTLSLPWPLESLLQSWPKPLFSKLTTVLRRHFVWSTDSALKRGSHLNVKKHQVLLILLGLVSISIGSSSYNEAGGVSTYFWLGQFSLTTQVCRSQHLQLCRRYPAEGIVDISPFWTTKVPRCFFQNHSERNMRELLI